MENMKQIIATIENLETQKESLNSQLKLGIIDTDGAREESDMITKKERTLREKLVLDNHVTADGKARSISHHSPTDSNPKDYYITKMPDGKKIKAATYDGLIDKLYAYYAGEISDHSIKAVFEAALLEKKVTENPKLRTIEKIEGDFKRFISDDLAGRDIRYVTDIDLKKYIQSWVTERHPKRKTFLSFKGVLNLIFDYALMHRIITENPVRLIKNKPYMKSCDTTRAKSEEKIFSPEEISILSAEVRRRMDSGLKRFDSYYIHGYAMLFAIETGVRVGELCAMKWEDVKEDHIHIHAQQLFHTIDGKKEYYYAPYTKNEKGESEDGRQFPLTDAIKSLLDEIKAKQTELRIESEFIFCNKDGRWIIEEAYSSFLRRLCRSKGLKATNNHAFRMSLNSNVLIPKDVAAADRAALLGHSIETNLKHYSYAQRNYLEDVRAKLNSKSEDSVSTAAHIGLTV